MSTRETLTADELIDRVVDLIKRKTRSDGSAPCDNVLDWVIDDIRSLRGTFDLAPGAELGLGWRTPMKLGCVHGRAPGLPCPHCLGVGWDGSMAPDGALFDLLEVARVEAKRAFQGAMHAAGYQSISSAATAADHAKTAHDSVDIALVRLGQPSDGGIK